VRAAPYRPVETVFDGLDLGVVAIDGDEVEIALGLTLNHQELVGAERTEAVGVVERTRGL
jgi:hypothetical protein